MRRIGELRTVAIASAAAGIGLALYATASIAVIFVASIALGIAITFFNVGYVTLMQRSTSLEMQGRVMSAADAAITFPYLISFLVGAAVVSVVDFHVIYIVEGICLLLMGAYFAWRTEPSAVPAATGPEPDYAADSIDAS